MNLWVTDKVHGQNIMGQCMLTTKRIGTNRIGPKHITYKMYQLQNMSIQNIPTDKMYRLQNISVPNRRRFRHVDVICVKYCIYWREEGEMWGREGWLGLSEGFKHRQMTLSTGQKEWGFETMHNEPSFQVRGLICIKYYKPHAILKIPYRPYSEIYLLCAG
jgi:hypothetical protein